MAKRLARTFPVELKGQGTGKRSLNLGFSIDREKGGVADMSGAGVLDELLSNAATDVKITLTPNAEKDAKGQATMGDVGESHVFDGEADCAGVALRQKVATGTLKFALTDEVQAMLAPFHHVAAKIKFTRTGEAKPAEPEETEADPV